MAAKSFLQMNQLQFNLNAHPSANNLMYKQRNPEPIFIERLGKPNPNQKTWTPSGIALNNSMQFSAISEDKLSAAVLLAKRDLKNQKIAEQMRLDRPPSPVERGRSRTKMAATKAGQATKKKNVGFKPARNVTDTVKQTANRYIPQAINRPNTSILPATTNSPPTRDTDRYPIHKVHVPLSDNIDDITRMQKELESYLNQIRTIQEKAITNENTEFLTKRRSRSKDGYLSDEDDSDRRAARSKEENVRTARNLYNLRQQVRQIQKDFIQLGSTDIKQTKKSQAFSKLTAAHRGAVRSMQAFINQLPHQDLRQGLPTSYKELALLIRQLTMLNSQLERGTDMTVNNQLIAILDKVDELNEIWRSDIKAHNTSKCQQNSSSASVRPPFNLDFKQDNQNKIHQKFYGNNSKSKDIPKRQVRKDIGIHKPLNLYRAGSPSRKATLRAGVASLLKFSGRDRTKKTGVMFNIPNKGQKKSGYMLPAHLQSKREKISRPVHPVISDSHFADPTIAANLKSVASLSNPILDQRPLSAPASPDRYSPRQGEKEPWIPPGTPNCCGIRSPLSERRSQSHSPSASRRYLIEDLDNSLIRRLFPENPKHQQKFAGNRERKHGKNIARPRSVSPRPWADSRRQSSSRSPSPSPRFRKRALSDSLIEDIADEVRRKLDIRAREEDRYYKSYPQASKANKILRRSQEDLTNMIIDDVLDDTVHNLQHIQTKDKMHQQALALQHSPTIENLLQRLQQMEDEQEVIRCRWQSVTYDDPRPKTQYFSSYDILSERPRSPPAIQISCTRKQDTQITRNSNKSRVVCQEIVPEPILFTKPKTTKTWTQTATRKDCTPDEFNLDPISIPSYNKPKTQVSVSQTIVSKIEDNRETFQRHLKKMSHHPMGKFNPWKLVEEITDQIMDECLLDVALELDDINEDMANHLYKSEFILANGQSPSSVAHSETMSPDPISNGRLSDEWEASHSEHNEDNNSVEM